MPVGDSRFGLLFCPALLSHFFRFRVKCLVWLVDYLSTSRRSTCPCLAWRDTGFCTCCDGCCLQFGCRRVSLLRDCLRLVWCRPLVVVYSHMIRVRDSSLFLLHLVVGVSNGPACGPPHHVY